MSNINFPRRDFFARSSSALTGTAFASLLFKDGFAQQTKDFDHTPKAKRVIYLYMAGGPSQFESFDDKPKLRENNGKPIPKGAD